MFQLLVQRTLKKKSLSGDSREHLSCEVDTHTTTTAEQQDWYQHN